MKTFLSEYGRIIVAIIVIVALLSLGHRFSGSVRDNTIADVDKFQAKVDKTMTEMKEPSETDKESDGKPVKSKVGNHVHFADGDEIQLVDPSDESPDYASGIWITGYTKSGYPLVHTDTEYGCLVGQTLWSSGGSCIKKPINLKGYSKIRIIAQASIETGLNTNWRAYLGTSKFKKDILEYNFADYLNGKRGIEIEHGHYRFVPSDEYPYLVDEIEIPEEYRDCEEAYFSLVQLGVSSGHGTTLMITGLELLK